MYTIVLGVTGGISAYKSANIVSLLKKEGCCVHVIMTQNATKFITPHTLEVLSGNRVYIDMWQHQETDVSHITLATSADLILIAPTTYNMVGKIANGIADDMLSTVISATKKPVYFALAMNEAMYENPIIHKNISYLQTLGYNFIEPTEGMLACGVYGKGKLQKEELIVATVMKSLSSASTPLAGKTVLITAGRTEEPLDPIRYFSNKSSGKMGYALASIAIELGATVTLISGPTELAVPHGVTRYIPVRSAQEMYQATVEEYHDKTIVIACAAVADYMPASYSFQKIKKTEQELHIVLQKTKDILQALGEQKQKQFLVGFAAETENLQENAMKKLHAKHLDMIIANHASAMQQNTNSISIIHKDGSCYTYKEEEKTIVARNIFTHIIEQSVQTQK